MRTGRVPGTDLRGLLAHGARPQAELPLALEGGCLVIGGANDHHVTVKTAQVVEVEVRERGIELVVWRARAIRRKKLERRLA